MNIGFDIGGTSMRAAAVSMEGIGPVFKRPTPPAPSDALEELVSLCGEAAGGEPIENVCGGIPGIPGMHGDILTAPNLPQWKGFALGALLSERLHAFVSVRHDADLAGLGEAIYGAGANYAVVAYMGIGTGVGGTRIAGGAIDSALVGFEAGHQIIDIANKKALDAYVSGRSIAERYQREPKDVARESYDELTPFLAVGVYNMMLHWSPNIFVLGGSLMNEENGFRVEDITRALQALPLYFPEWPPLRKAELGDAAGLHGARHLLVGKAGTGFSS